MTEEDREMRAIVMQLAGAVGLPDEWLGEPTLVILKACYNRVLEAKSLFSQGVMMLKGDKK